MEVKEGHVRDKNKKNHCVHIKRMLEGYTFIIKNKEDMIWSTQNSRCTFTEQSCNKSSLLTTKLLKIVTVNRLSRFCSWVAAVWPFLTLSPYSWERDQEQFSFITNLFITSVCWLDGQNISTPHIAISFNLISRCASMCTYTLTAFILRAYFQWCFEF